MSKEKILSHIYYLIFVQKLHNTSDTITTVEELKTKISESINETITENAELLVSEYADLQKLIQTLLNLIQKLNTSDLYTYEPVADGSKRKRQVSSGKRKKLSNKRRLSGRGSRRRRGVISRRRR